MRLSFFATPGMNPLAKICFATEPGTARCLVAWRRLNTCAAEALRNARWMRVAACAFDGGTLRDSRLRARPFGNVSRSSHRPERLVIRLSSIFVATSAGALSMMNSMSCVLVIRPASLKLVFVAFFPQPDIYCTLRVSFQCRGPVFNLILYSLQPNSFHQPQDILTCDYFQ